MLDISLIIPVFNNSEGVKHLFQSIGNNKFKEIIIVDDGSSELEFQKLEKLSKKNNNILLTKNRGGKGAGGARNTGVQIATCKWLLFSDSDDEFQPEYDKELIKYNNILSDIVFFPPTSKDESGNVGSRHNVYISYFKSYWEKNDSSYLKYKLPVVWSRLFDRNFIKENQIFFDEILSSNDKMFSIKAGVSAHNITVSNKEIYCWNYNKNSLTTRPSKTKFEDMVRVSYNANLLLNSELSKKEFRKAATSISKLMAMSLFRNNFGPFYSYRLLLFLIKGHFPLFSTGDFSKARNFFRNNKYYK